MLYLICVRSCFFPFSTECQVPMVAVVKGLFPRIQDCGGSILRKQCEYSHIFPASFQVIPEYVYLLVIKNRLNLRVFEPAVKFYVNHVLRIPGGTFEANHSFEFEICNFVICWVVVPVMRVRLERFQQVEEPVLFFSIILSILEDFLYFNESILIGIALECVPLVLSGCDC